MKISRLYIANILLVIISITLGLYAANGVVLLGDNPTARMSLGLFLPISLAALLSFIALIILNIKLLNYRPSMPIMIAFAIAFIVTSITLLVYPLEQTFIVHLQNGETPSIVMTLTSLNKLIYIFQFLLVLIISYEIVDTIPKIFKDTNTLRYFCYLNLSVVGFLMIYSYITEYSSYYHIVTEPNHFWILQYAVESMLPHKNSYGIILFTGIVSSLILHQERFKWYWAALSIFILFNMFFTMSKASLLISGLLLLGYFIMRFIQTIKLHFKMNIITLSVVASISLLGIILISALGKWSSIINLLNLKDGLSTADNRIIIWDKAVQILNQTNWLSGTGYHYFNDILLEFNKLENPTAINPDITEFSHNMFLEFIGEGGIVLLLIAIAIIGYVIYILIKGIKQYQTTAIFELMLLSVLIIHAFFESGAFIFANTMEYAYIGLTLFMPSLSMKQNLKLELNL